MSTEMPGLECMEQLITLKDLIRKDKIKPPIPFILHNHEKGHSGEINSVNDIEIIHRDNFILGIKVRCGEEIIEVTPHNEFLLKVGRDGEGKAVFLTNLNK